VTSRGDTATATSTGLGQRIREARIAKGLTQSSLAGAEFSVGFISRIESGARQPSRHTITTLATRLQVSVDYLLSGFEPGQALALRHDVDRAELALAGGDIDEALTASASLLEGGELREWPELVRRARLIHALAQESTGDVHSAIIELEDLRLVVEDGESATAVGIALSRCYRETGDFTLAIETGERVLGSLEHAGLAGTTEHVRLSVTVAAAYYESGAVGVATRMARRAIKSAEANSSPEAQAAAYWNASIIERDAGNVERAVGLASRALAILEGGNSTRNLARLRSQLALIQLRSPEAELSEIRALLELAGRELEWSSASPVDRARHTVAEARLALRESEPERALVLLERVAVDVCHQEPLVSGEVSVLTTVALVVQSRPAGTAFDEAAMILDLLGTDRGVAQLWFELAEAMEVAGDQARAMHGYRQAALGLGAARVLLPVHDRPGFVLPARF
jgi:transcriptional regulator with XRE-family HTH domain